MPHFRPSWPQAIVHVDGDAFFASCEQAMHPEYRGKPVITGKERGIVAAASYEAKALGITRGVALWDVKKICPDAIILPSDYESYSLFSKRMFEIMRRFTGLVEEYSIDEAFADITGLRRPLRASYADIGRRIKDAIESDLGITVSVGISLSKTLAKIGSKWKKPSGLVPIPGREIESYLAKLDAQDVWGIGPRTAGYCRTLGIRTALDFARKDEAYIARHFTRPHIETWRELNGEVVFPVVTDLKDSYASIGKTKTFTPPSSDRAFVFGQLLKNIENACIKARRHKLAATGAVFYLRKQDFRSAGSEVSFSRATAFPLEIGKVAEGVFGELFEPRTLYRSTGVVLVGLQADDPTQLDLFDAPLKLEKMKKLYAAVDELAERYGKHCVYTAGALAAHQTPQHALDRGDVPDRKTDRLPGETKRQHIGVPMIMQKLT